MKQRALPLDNLSTIKNADEKHTERGVRVFRVGVSRRPRASPRYVLISWNDACSRMQPLCLLFARIRLRLRARSKHRSFLFYARKRLDVERLHFKYSIPSVCIPFPREFAPARHSLLLMIVYCDLPILIPWMELI